jgi:hypothetical protein
VLTKLISIIESKGVKHALSIFSSFNFETIHVQLSLRDVKTGNVIAIDRLSYIEEVELGS